MQPDDAEWEQLKRTLQPRQRVRARVVSHEPFGVFMEIPGTTFRGLIQITDFLDAGRMVPEDYPPLGAELDTVVLGFTDAGRKQVWLGVRPSQLAGSSQ